MLATHLGALAGWRCGDVLCWWCCCRDVCCRSAPASAALDSILKSACPRTGVERRGLVLYQRSMSLFPAERPGALLSRFYTPGAQVPLAKFACIPLLSRACHRVSRSHSFVAAGWSRFNSPEPKSFRSRRLNYGWLWCAGDL